MTIRHTIVIAAVWLSSGAAAQQHFPKQIAAGNYSGICHIGAGRYAVVNDKSDTDGFAVFYIQVDTLRGRITAIADEGFRDSGQPNRDGEGICYCPATNTIFISGERDNQVLEYTLDGKLTGRRLQMPPSFAQSNRNFGLESLAYDEGRQLLFTTTERPLPGDSLLRIQTFGTDLTPRRQYLYSPDAPISPKHFHGVSELCALPDGRLLVLERQIKVPRLKIGATTVVRIYEVRPGENEKLQKRLLLQFKTRLNLFSRKFANYEGMCHLGGQQLLLIADSQNRLKGFLRDWFKIVRLAP